MSVKNSPELREAYEAMQPATVQFWNRMSQSQPLYEGFKALRNSEEWQKLEESQRRIVETSIRDAELSGVGLTGDAKDFD
jgi:oligopeptidase A